MKNLLKCEYSRLFKSSAFKWVILYMLFLLTINFVFGDYYFYQQDPSTFNNDSSLFKNINQLMIIIPLFIASFIGTEFSDGTVRNKLVSGKTRSQIYMTDYIVTYSFTAAINIILVAIEYILGNIFFEAEREITMEKIGIFILYSSVFFAAYNAIFIIIPMLIHKKSAASTISALGCFGMYISPIIIEMLTSYKKIFAHLFNILPNCSLYKISVLSDAKMSVALISSAVIFVGFIFIGTFAFKKENLK